MKFIKVKIILSMLFWIAFGVVIIYKLSNFYSFEVSRENIAKCHTEKEDIIIIVNKIRKSKGLRNLEWNRKLTNSAYLKACDMYTRKYWSHITPEGISPWSFFKKVGYDYKYAGENLCRNGSDEECVRLWMLSPKHRENILSDRYQDIGVGRCGNIIVQHFGTKE